ncbi:TPR-like protein [Punctularia strigosozonata HHB-11173 SS5]|uniref:TPR-like protein n=1 Tax=Punctularia strigosozonata (strain HHB-11173) TaxID=741275 RepID=R7S2F2_PUNST|nr:TPR-like protein [Punctularia strigosozonata HHB-11173 SS5]EIN03962.1 TPR-like protein [Punctularia strigosozonata HHB-11173 SS5]
MPEDQREPIWQRRFDHALANTNTFLSLLEALTEGVIICEPLKGAVKLAKAVIEIKVRKNQKDCRELARHTCKLMISIVAVLEGRSTDEIPDRLKTCIDNVACTLSEVKAGLETLQLQKRFSFKSLRRACLRREYVAEEIASYSILIDRCLQQFQVVMLTVGPTVLVLDNFESPWDAGGTHASLTKLLGALAALSNLQLVVTMRGDHPPAKEHVRWNPVCLAPLSMESAKALFLSMNPHTKAAEYQDLDVLLEKVDGLPLAIDLLAKQKGVLPCSLLLQRWKSQSTALLTTEPRFPTRLTSLDVSIMLSLNSESMKAAPDALALLAIICHLPDGLTRGSDQLVDMNLGFENVHQSLSALLCSALAYISPGGSIKVLSPIRQHIIIHHDLPQSKYQKLLQYYTGLIDEHASVSPGYGDFEQASNILLPETGNIIHLLVQELRLGRTCTPGIARAAFSFSKFQCWTRHSTEIIDKLLSQWPIHGLDVHRAKGLVLRARLLGCMRHYAMAQRDLDAALVECHRFEDQETAAECLYYSGIVYRSRSEATKAIEKFTHAHDAYSKIGDDLGIANCLQNLGDIYCTQKKYTEAIENTSRAHVVFSQIGDRRQVGNCLERLAYICYVQGAYTEAIAKLVQAHDTFSEIGDRLGVASCLQSSGDIFYMRNEHTEAIANLIRAHDIYSEIGDRLGVAECLQSMGDIYRMQKEYTRATEAFKRAHDVYVEAGDGLGAASSLRILGSIHRDQNEYAEAINKLTQALKIYSETGNQLGATQCLQSLGDIDRAQEQYYQAADKLNRALDVASSTGDIYQIAWCRIYIGLLDRDQCRYNEALMHITLARSLFTGIGQEGDAGYCSDLIAEIHQSMSKKGSMIVSSSVATPAQYV